MYTHLRESEGGITGQVTGILLRVQEDNKGKERGSCGDLTIHVKTPQSEPFLCVGMS